MRRRFLDGALMGLTALVSIIQFPSHAFAAASSNSNNSCSVGQFSGTVNCGGSFSIVSPAPPPLTRLPGSRSAVAGPVSASTTNPNTATIPYLISRNLAPCVGFYTFPTPGPLSARAQGVIQQIVNLFTSQYSLCSARAAVPAAVAVDPAILAASFWETIPLPAPRPNIPPGYAITGKPAYLVTNGTLNPAPYHQQTVVGSLAIKAHGTYQVDWGDGATGGPYQSEGQPWPHGTIAHTYDSIGAYNVIVTEIWTATWQLGAAHGTLTRLTTRGTIPTFPVRQIQAVITG